MERMSHKLGLINPITARTVYFVSRFSRLDIHEITVYYIVRQNAPNCKHPNYSIQLVQAEIAIAIGTQLPTPQIVLTRG